MNSNKILCLCLALLPACRIKNAALRRLGWSIGENVVVGSCLVIGVSQFRIRDNAIVGPFNVFRGLTEIDIAESAIVGQWNWITASYDMKHAGSPACLELKPHSAITSRHYIDCTGGVRIGAYTTIAGQRSTFITHGIDWRTSEQTFASIEIGDYCLLSSNLQVTPNTVIGDKVVIGMGATVAGHLAESGLYLQPRAQLVKNHSSGYYFERVVGHVDRVKPRSDPR